MSIVTLAAVIWAARFLLPRAAKQNDLFPLVCGVLTLVLAVLLWFLVGIPQVF